MVPPERSRAAASAKDMVAPLSGSTTIPGMIGSVAIQRPLARSKNSVTTCPSSQMTRVSRPSAWPLAAAKRA
jgi:hypothetical protein